MKNLTFKAAMLKGSQPTVNRQSTDGQSQRHCKQTPLSKRWKVLMTLVFLFTFAIGNVWAAEVIEERTATNDAGGMKNAGIYLKAVALGSNATWSSNKLKISSNKTSSFTVEINSTYSSTYTIKSLVFEWDGSGRPSSFSGNSIAVSGNTTWSAGTTTPTKVDFAITTGGSEIKIKKITATLTPKGSSCTAPTSPSVTASPSASYTEGDNISLSASATGTTSGTTTYTWYKGAVGDNWATVSATTPIQTASTTGSSFTIENCKTSDEGVYWCNISNGDNCNAQASLQVSVAASSSGEEPADNCSKIFAFANTADVPTGITNSTSTFTGFSTGSNNCTGEITIDGAKYTISKRGSNSTFSMTFSVPSGKVGTLYGLANSSGSSARTLTLTGPNDYSQQQSTSAANSSAAAITFTDMPAGAYTLAASSGASTPMLCLKLCDVPKYTVTINPNGGSYASAPEGWTLSAGVYTKEVEGGNFSAPAGLAKGTDDLSWKDNKGNDIEFPVVIDKDTTFIAQWAAHAASSNANLSALSVADCELNETFDPATTAYTISLPFYGVMPAASAVTATKADPHASDPVVSVEGNVITVEVTPESGATGKKTYTITVNIADAPAASSSINIEQGVLDYTTKWGYAAALTSANIAVVDPNALDSLKDQEGRNEPFLGLKLKKATSKVTIIVPSNEYLKIKFGSINSDAGLKVSVNGSTAVAPEVTEGVYTLPASAGVKEVVFTLAAAEKTVVLKQIMINEDIKAVTLPWKVSFDVVGHANAVSPMIWKGTALTLPGVSNIESGYAFENWNDGSNDYLEGAEYTPTNNVTLTAVYTMTVEDRMAELEFNGVAVAGFSPDIQVYNLTTPYAEALPQITKAVAVDEANGATATIQETYWDDDNNYYVAQAYVIPAGGTSSDAKFYQVRFTMDPKLGATIFRADLTAENAADFSGMYVDADNSQVALKKDGDNNNEYKFAGTSNFIKMALADATFAEGDMLKMTYSTNPQQAELAIYDGTTKLQGTPYTNHTMTFTDVVNGKSTLFIRRTNDNTFNGWVAAVEVQRYMDPFIAELKVGDALATIDEEANPKTITIEVPASTDITSLTPSIKAYANGGATVTPADPQDFSAGAVAYTVTSYYGETTTYQVTVTKAEASHDATLSALSVEGYNLSPAFDPAVLTYNVELAKGTVIADLPAVSYTLNHAGATAVKTNATVLPGATTIVVTAEDGLEENKKTYTINFTVSTKDIITIFDGSTMDAIATSPDATSGASWEAVGLSVSSSNKVTGYTHIIATGGSTGTSKYIAVTIPENYAPQFVIAHATNSNGNERNAMIGTSNTRPALEDALFVVASSSSSSASESTSGVLSENTTYYIHADQSINFVKIQLILEQLAPKCAAPVISGLADVQVCNIASAELNGTATVADGGTVSYKWYAEGGTDVLATTATYTPTAVGNYYVVATNTLADHRDNSTTSEVVSVSLYEATSVTMANISGKAAASIALNAVAEGPNPHYAWFTCDDAEGNNAVAIAGAADAASYAIPTPVATQYYKVVVTTDCGNASAVALVTLLPDIVPLADVTENTVWDWTEITARADGSAIDEVIDNKNHGPRVATANGLVLANYVLGGSYWDKIEGNNNAYAIRNTSNVYYQGASLHMHTTKGGILKINARNDGSAMKMKIGSAEFALTSTFTDYVVYVPAGDVTIENVPETAGKPMRVAKITFTVDETPDYTRTEMLGNGVYGTICLPYNVPAGGVFGVTIYELMGREPQYGKLAFDEIVSGEMEAGVPYVFQAHGDALSIFYGETHVDDPVSKDNGMYGTFTNQTLTDLDDVYYFAQRALWSCDDLTELNLPANRAYVKLSEIDYLTDPNPAPGRRRITMTVNGEKVTTGIGEIETSETPMKVLIDGQIFIIRGEKMFDVTGKLVK